ncbi:class I SAM-dependent methyltransferase [Streptococcus massiliensis]|uniref:SAM-dependent methyltransferase n=1 Tax=Streptococcus massiliensis TaxID=313439 RepID=A0A380KW96_9STRE|nr:class I SAM-dependent methyltransferase [Streptococcus massiliensis]SUN75821.1 SAM-dependent methyltransferase [Streptococcus massiliensis]
MLPILLIAISFLLFIYYLIQQSKHPQGIVGRLMMKIWNRAYLPMVDWALSFILRQDFSKILDIGVGNGRSTLRLKQLFPSSQIYGLDISETAIAEARKLSKTINFEVKDVANTGYESESFDLICAFQTHFHWTDLTKALLEIKRILQPDGQLILACEWSKISYYLAEFKDLSNFKNYLNELGLQVLRFEKNPTWVYYQIGKIKE